MNPEAHFNYKEPPRDSDYFDPETATIAECDRELTRLQRMLTSSERSSDGDASWIREQMISVEEIRKKLTR